MKPNHLPANRVALNRRTKLGYCLSLRLAVLSTLFLAGGAASVPAAQSTNELEQLKSVIQSMEQTIEGLKVKIQQLEKQQKEMPKPFTLPEIPATKQSHISDRDSLNNQQIAAPRPDSGTLDPKFTGYFPIPRTPAVMKINVKPRVDFTLDNRYSGNSDRFVPAQIPIEGTPQHGGGNDFNVNARGSQLSLDVRAPGIPGDPRLYFENDFFAGGNNGGMTPRVRHFYGQYFNVTAGYTFSVFEDPDAWPDTVDYEGPVSAIFARQPGIRYLLSLSDKWQMNFGIQQPSTDLDPGVFTDAGSKNHAPDGGFNVRWEDETRGHVQFGTLFRALGADGEVAGNQTVFGWGVNLAGSLNVFDKDSVQFQATYGEGIFHYINDNFINNDVTYDAKGDLAAIPYFGAMLGYTHHWSDQFRSTASFGYNTLDNEVGQGAMAYHKTYYGSLNLMYQLRKRLTVGIEGLYGRKEVQSGDDGDVWRMQVGISYALFPSGVN